ncbi:hypothetical protein V1512DRAFT_266219 [Lipomyces arxii]|uniref:uncharacterized protein n=1 Tax=Lipomyces arxii TaxID=56418 RepID=UPI0034CEEC1B
MPFYSNRYWQGPTVDCPWMTVHEDNIPIHFDRQLINSTKAHIRKTASDTHRGYLSSSGPPASSIGKRKRKQSPNPRRREDLPRILLEDGKSSKKRDDFLTTAMKQYPGPPITIYNDVDDNTAPDFNFVLVSDYIYTEGVAPPNLEAESGCNCPLTGCVDPNICDCAEPRIDLDGNEEMVFPYIPGPYLDVNDNVVECNVLCSCPLECRNRVTQQPRSLELQLFYSKLKGWGLRSPRMILGGTFVLTYPGEIITSSEAERREHENKLANRHTYIFDLDKLEQEDCYAVDAGRYGGLARYINHSCSPNLEIVAVMEGRASQRVYKIALFACKDIPANEELCFDYLNVANHNKADDDSDGSVVEIDPYVASQRCYCQSKNCRQYIWYR